MEALKELVVASNACLLVAALGTIATAAPSTRRAGRRAVIAALLLLVVFSSGWTATALLSPLEHAHGTARPHDGDPPARAIVVLGAFGVLEPGLPLSSWPNDAGLFRIVEAIHQLQRCPGCRIYVTGSSTTAESMARVMLSLGVPAKDIEVDGSAGTTAASARNLAERLRGISFYLVTSAGHMPRAMLAFGALGLQPLPAPTDYRVSRNFGAASPWPTPQNLRLSDLAVHEYLGILWYRFQDIKPAAVGPSRQLTAPGSRGRPSTRPT